MGECWGAGTATFMILGNTCTRSCAFCAVATGKPDAVDFSEPDKVADAIAKMQVKHAVITSVDRDDLKDCGAEIWAETVQAVREHSPNTTMETLLPDFKGKLDLLDIVLDTRPEVVSHNMETVRRLTRKIRPQSNYQKSLEVLSHIRHRDLSTKSGIMLGLGESKAEVFETITDLYNAGVEILTVGQYLAPTKQHATLVEYITPELFEEYKQFALGLGYKVVESSALVRSSYHAENHLLRGVQQALPHVKRKYKVEV